MLKEFQYIGEELVSNGLVEPYAGSLSIRKDRSIFITRNQIDLGKIKEEDILEVGLEDESNDKDAARELYIHRSIYNSTGHLAVIHARPVYALTLSMTESKLIPSDSEGSALLRAVPIIWVKDPIGTKEALRHLSPVFAGNYIAAMIRGHASFTVGKTLEEAYKITCKLEKTAQIVFNQKVLSPAQPKPSMDPRHGNNRRTGIPPGLGVMDRSRNRAKNYRGRTTIK